MDSSYAKIASNIKRELNELLTMIDEDMPSSTTLIFKNHITNKDN